MQVPVTDAKAKLTDLVRRAELGDEIVLTRHGRPVVQLIAMVSRPDPARRLKTITEMQVAAERKVLPGLGAAQSQDFLYDENGLP